MTIILGALQSISADMYEAAEVDGASWWVSLCKITIPMLRPAVLPAVVLSSITTFQMFNTVFLITGGGPTNGVSKPGATDLVMTFAYKQTFQQGNYGYISAFAVIIFLILLVATLLSLRVTNVTQGAFE
jgi:arabinogalactan oligomer/maltooligosaccharide transport system permease protein